jgi:hypothetical protein
MMALLKGFKRVTIFTTLLLLTILFVSAKVSQNNMVSLESEVNITKDLINGMCYRVNYNNIRERKREQGIILNNDLHKFDIFLTDIATCFRNMMRLAKNHPSHNANVVFEDASKRILRILSVIPTLKKDIKTQYDVLNISEVVQSHPSNLSGKLSIKLMLGNRRLQETKTTFLSIFDNVRSMNNNVTSLYATSNIDDLFAIYDIICDMFDGLQKSIHYMNLNYKFFLKFGEESPSYKDNYRFSYKVVCNLLIIIERALHVNYETTKCWPDAIECTTVPQLSVKSLPYDLIIS